MADFEDSLNSLQLRLQTLESLFGLEDVSNLAVHQQKFQRNLQQLERFKDSLTKVGIADILERCKPACSPISHR